MRRLTKQDRDDSGVVTLLVIGMIPVLLLAAAAAIDVNRFSQENSSAQHSADATAMAVATDCVNFGSHQGDDEYEKYRKTDSENDNDQQISDATPIACSVDDQGPFVRIEIEKNVDGGLVRDRNARWVRKDATVRWGALSSASTAPVVVAQCTFDVATANGTTFPSLDVIIPLGSGDEEDAEAECKDRPPGAFGWLDEGPQGSCLVPTTLNADGELIVKGNSGNAGVQVNGWNCITAVGVGGTITIPIYAASCLDASPCAAGENEGRGNNNYYLILGFAEIELTGWNLQHGDTKEAGIAPDCPGNGSVSCISGRFVRFSKQLGSSGSGTDFGLTVIYLSS